MSKWKLVPIEPTPGMCNAALIKMMSGNVPISGIYRAMLEAAPQPPKLSDERILELFAEHSKQYDWPFGFARAVEREILGIEQEQSE